MNIAVVRIVGVHDVEVAETLGQRKPVETADELSINNDEFRTSFRDSPSKTVQNCSVTCKTETMSPLAVSVSGLQQILV
jgi:hypothetical protein